MRRSVKHGGGSIVIWSFFAASVSELTMNLNLLQESARVVLSHLKLYSKNGKTLTQNMCGRKFWSSQHGKNAEKH